MGEGAGIKGVIGGGCRLSPSTGWRELLQARDDLDAFQAAPAKLPAIDIHSLLALPDAKHRRSRQAAGLGDTPHRSRKNAA